MGQTRKKEYHHGDLHTALVEAAARLAAEQGVAALSLREVARIAGVSHAAPYHHFKDKSALLAAVAEEGFRRFDMFQLKALRAAPSRPSAQLKALGKAYVHFAIKNPHFFRIMFRKDFVEPEFYPSLSEVASRTFDRLVTTVSNCLKESPETDPMPLSITAWALVHGLASLWLDGPLTKHPAGNKGIETLINWITGELGKIINPNERSNHRQQKTTRKMRTNKSSRC
jgi:AcrR family transcriptional regulator